MNIIDNHVDCLLVTKHLIKVFEERKEEIHHQILGMISCFLHSFCDFFVTSQHAHQNTNQLDS